MAFLAGCAIFMSSTTPLKQQARWLTQLGTEVVDPIKFNEVFLNIGNAYSSSSGRFTCAYSGVHQFFFSANSQQKVPTELCLMVNSWCRVTSKADPDKNVTGNVGMALLELQKGNTVWVSQVMGGSWANVTFGGMLL
uniref:C1q domain-containing protein n=1 Tax=Erpetoichthys calabaricus TaxID=27687 RepID=A0A8C4SWP7_ERPCA